MVSHLERDLHQLPAGLVVPTYVEGILIQHRALENLLHEKEWSRLERCQVSKLDDWDKYPRCLSSHVTFLIATQSGHHTKKSAGYWARHLEVRALTCELVHLRDLGIVHNEDMFLAHVQRQQAKPTGTPFRDLPERVLTLADGAHARADARAVAKLVGRTVEAIEEFPELEP